MKFDLENVPETNEELIEIRDRANHLVNIWPDKEALKAYIDSRGGEFWDSSGVCAVVDIDIMYTDGLSDQIARSFKGVHLNRFDEADTCYPIAGRKEYVESAGLARWSNPKRLRYVKHIIKSIDKIIKQRSLQVK